MNTLLIAHIAATWGMTAVIWFVQVVHYPLFAAVGEASFVGYERSHVTRISFIVMPLMLTELLTAIGLVMSELPRTQTITGLVLIGAIWLSTFALSVPAHNALAEGFDAATHARLVSTNWVRTVLWTVRAILVGFWLASALKTAS